MSALDDDQSEFCGFRGAEIGSKFALAKGLGSKTKLKQQVPDLRPYPTLLDGALGRES